MEVYAGMPLRPALTAYKCNPHLQTVILALAQVWMGSEKLSTGYCSRSSLFNEVVVLPYVSA